MAMNVAVLDALLKVANQFAGEKRVASLGYPDLLVTHERLVGFFGADVLASAARRPDLDRILSLHGLTGQMNCVYDTIGLLASRGIHMDCLDIVATRGSEIVVDLNEQIPSELVGQYEIVFDGGTMEHCFNVPQVLKNILAMTKVGGYIVHVNPLNMFNHGFYSFSPTFYHDFYSQGGHRLAAAIHGFNGPSLAPNVFTLPTVQRFDKAPERASLIVIAQKMVERDAGWPVQTKYLTMIPKQA
ncbi:hypothetical protein ACFPL7_06800 [Dongia soli]|uniref:Methyltransferase family protein n=1 Tax=Dongia soli TaxID=600628 RepID=A0ABU5EAP4_9PROT|nr:hypothetical protein [Dongia soli]MDY0882650.1 hypothetical protein [Dongia soli]